MQMLRELREGDVQGVLSAVLSLADCVKSSHVTNDPMGAGGEQFGRSRQWANEVQISDAAVDFLLLHRSFRVEGLETRKTCLFLGTLVQSWSARCNDKGRMEERRKDIRPGFSPGHRLSDHCFAICISGGGNRRSLHSGNRALPDSPRTGHANCAEKEGRTPHHSQAASQE